MDTWNGHKLLKTFVRGCLSGVMTEWMAFLAFLGVPLFVMCVGLFAQSDRWWEVTGLTWFCSVTAFYFIFVGTCVYYETTGCIALIRHHYCERDARFLDVLKVAVLLRQMHTYSGYTRTSYFAKGILNEGKEGLRGHNMEEMHTKRTSIYSKMIKLGFLQKIGLFVKLDAPQQTFKVEDVQDYHFFLTKTSWTLEKAFCRPDESRFVAVIRGPDSLTKGQLRSSVACSSVGTIFILLIISAAFTWLGFGPLVQLGYWVITTFFFIIPRLIPTWRMLRLYRGILGEMKLVKQLDEIRRRTKSLLNHGRAESKAIDLVPERVGHDEAQDSCRSKLPIKQEKEAQVSNSEDLQSGGKTSDSENEAIFVIWESWRVVKPTDLWCWMTFVIEFFFLFLWPTIALFIVDNLAIALVFVGCVVFTYLRHELNPAVVIKEIGSFDGIQGKGSRLHKEEYQTILNDIVSNVTTARGQNLWVGFFSLILTVCLFLSFATIVDPQPHGDHTASDAKQLNYASDFEYVKVANLPYETCAYGNALVHDDIPVTLLVDWVFAALMAYTSNNATQGQLDSWFGHNVVKNRADIVSKYRTSTGSNDLPIVYRLYEFTALDTAIVSIQGTAKIWDLFADAQLWSTALLLQGLRAVLPLGQIWTPIMVDLVFAMSWLDSPVLNKLSYYKETTKFVNFLKDNKFYGNLVITGHSLGGGLAIISGSQTGVPAIAVSGPNALISRKSFLPMLTTEQLNTLSFNIVPDRDPVAHVDDVARLSQRILCRADLSDIFGCHDVERTLCEIMFTCGSDGRPFICECTLDLGYPEPISRGNRTFMEACPGR